jgi:biotin-(acetyl-CoA carboxylase) ligase
LENLERWYHIALSDHPEQTFERWRELSCTLGNRVEVDLGDKVLTGIATRLDPTGSLYSTLDSGEEREILAGDVTMVANV